jgi:hypothetical protein
MNTTSAEGVPDARENSAATTPDESQRFTAGRNRHPGRIFTSGSRQRGAATRDAPDRRRDYLNSSSAATAP